LGVAAALFGIFALAITGPLRFSISPVTLWLGGISYSLYLSHHNLGYSLLARLHDVGLSVSSSFLITLAGALIMAALLTYTVEQPAMRALRRRGRMASPAAAARP
ncbi:MAG: acyltransferase family protein, partial [Gammaproteobacteria bacterium]